MPSIWIVSDERTLPETLGHHLRPLGAVWTGPPERSRWKEADAPDLIVVIGADTPEDFSDLERCLDFLAWVPRQRRAPQPVLFIEPPGGRPGRDLVRQLIDDRPLRVLGWPLETDELVAYAAGLLDQPIRPTSLRERARRAWVTRRVELFYAGIDLPALRQAVDPRNAHRPVLLIGEPGTGRGILSRYIHQRAEPARDDLLVIPAATMDVETEQSLLQRSAGRRVTLYLEGIDRVDRGVQERLLQLLGASGALELEPVRWIASVSKSRALIPALRQLPWIRVELPPLRARGDLDALARGLASLWSDRAGRPAELDENALATLGGYAWPGNLRELEVVIDATLAGASDIVARADDVRLGPSGAFTADRSPDPSERRRTPRAAATGDVGGAEAAAPAPTSERDSALSERDSALPAKSSQPDLAVVIPPLAQEIREPMLAIRTYANLLDQRPDDESVRREFSRLVEHDLGQLEDTINRLERFAGLKVDSAGPFDLAAMISAELERRADKIRACSADLTRELDHEAPLALADEERVRFAIGMLLDRALRMIPSDGELYVGTLYHPASADCPAHHRLLIRFESPEEVLIAPEDGPGPSQPLEVILARALIENIGGKFAVDVSGVQDNLILIELPG